MTETRLTAHARELLDLIRAHRGEWLTRGDMAQALEKTRLNIWEVKLLGDLVHSGLIEAQQVDAAGPRGYEWQYRARGQGNE